MKEKKERKKGDFPKNDPHLGGHGFKTHLDNGILELFKNLYNCKSMLDIGCGPGGMLKLAKDYGYTVEGIDGDYSLERDVNVILHDFSKGPYDHKDLFDLGYSCEFLEHVNEEYVPNFMNSFSRCKYVAISYAPPGTPGYHHVNCNTKEYWIEQFKKYNFNFDKTLTNQIIDHSTMKRDFFRSNGLGFINAN